MNVQEILTLLKHNASASEWGKIEQPNGVVSYCLEDVNLRLALLVTWQNTRPFQTIEILYAATTLLSFSIPVGPSLEFSSFADTLESAIGKFEEFVQTAITTLT
jgi:hypothetical protein